MAQNDMAAAKQTAEQQSDGSSSSGSNKIVLIAAVAGGIGGLLLLVLAVYCCCCKAPARQQVAPADLQGNISSKLQRPPSDDEHPRHAAAGDVAVPIKMPHGLYM